MPLATDKGQKQTKRFESISFIYLLFFVLAVMTPSIVSRDYFGISQTVLEETLIFVMGLASLMTVLIYERIMEKRLQEKEAATQNADRVTKELAESYKYIGSINRQLDLLKKLANETSLSLVTANAYWKDLLQSLASNAASCVDASRVLIRFVDLDTLRTDREIFFQPNSNIPLKLSNKELRNVQTNGSPHAFAMNEEGCELLIVPSDRIGAKIRTFLIVEVDSSQISDADISFVKVFANQAELVYTSLMQQRDTSRTPLALVEQVTTKTVGDVS